MNFLDAILLGVVEGVTEFLPVSSTAHLILAARAFGIPESEFLKSFEIAIQLGAILAVVTLYFRSFFDLNALKRIVAGFIPTALIGLVFYGAVKSMLGSLSIVLWALFWGGILMLIFERFYKRTRTSGIEDGRTEMTVKDAVAVGIFQCFAFVPGVSRSAATILGGLSLGLSRRTIAEFSFLLAVPTMAAATGLDLIKNREVIMHGGNIALLFTGLIVSYIVAIAAIRIFITYIKKHDFTPFAVYRVIAALIGIAIFL